MVSLEIADKLKEGFALRLKTLRESRHLSQKEFADQLGMTLAAYNRYERLNAQPSISLLVRMASAFQITLDTLVGYDTPNLMSAVDEACYKLNDIGIDYKILGSNKFLINIENETYTLDKFQIVDIVNMVDDYACKASNTVYRQFFLSEFQRDIKLVLSSSYTRIDKKSKRGK